MPTYTPNFDLAKPLVNNVTDQDLWGNQLNGDMDIIDTEMNVAQRFISDSLTTTYAVVFSDKHKQFNCSAASNYTVSLLSAATAGSGFTVAFKKVDATAFTITLDPNSTETIDGASTYVLSNENQAVVLVCDGTNWKVQSETVDPAEILNNSALTGVPTAPTAAPGTNTTQVATTAFVQQANPLKAYVVITGSSGAIISSKNVSNVVRNSAGNYTITFATAMANANYCPLISFGSSTVIDGSNGTFFRVNTASKTTTTLNILSTINGGAGDPTQLYVAVFM